MVDQLNRLWNVELWRKRQAHLRRHGRRAELQQVIYGQCRIPGCFEQHIEPVTIRGVVHRPVILRKAI